MWVLHKAFFRVLFVWTIFLSSFFPLYDSEPSRAKTTLLHLVRPLRLQTVSSRLAPYGGWNENETKQSKAFRNTDFLLVEELSSAARLLSTGTITALIIIVIAHANIWYFPILQIPLYSIRRTIWHKLQDHSPWSDYYIVQTTTVRASNSPYLIVWPLTSYSWSHSSC